MFLVYFNLLCFGFIFFLYFKYILFLLILGLMIELICLRIERIIIWYLNWNLNYFDFMV